MEAPLDQEAANADLITDIVTPTPDRSLGVAELARDLASGSPAWRAAWSLRTSEPVQDQRATPSS